MATMTSRSGRRRVDVTNDMQITARAGRFVKVEKTLASLAEGAAAYTLVFFLFQSGFSRGDGM